MKFSPRQILAFAFLLALPVALFLVLRAQASWRPQRVPGVTYHGLIAFSPDGKRFANAWFDGHEIVSLYDVATNREVASHDFGDHLSAMSFSPDGSTLAVAWPQGYESVGVMVWNFATQNFEFKTYAQNILHSAAIELVPVQLKFSTNSKTLWLASAGALRTWDVASEKLKMEREIVSDHTVFSHTALSPNCRFYMSFDNNGYEFWNIAEKNVLLRVSLPLQQKILPFYVNDRNDFSPNTSLLIYLADTPQGTFYLVIETRTGRILWRAPSDSDATFVGDKVALRKADKFEICDARTGKVVRRLNALPNTMPIASPSNDWLYSVDEDGGLFRQRLR